MNVNLQSLNVENNFQCVYCIARYRKVYVFKISRVRIPYQFCKAQSCSFTFIIQLEVFLVLSVVAMKTHYSLIRSSCYHIIAGNCNAKSGRDSKKPSGSGSFFNNELWDFGQAQIRFLFDFLKN